MGPRHFSRGSSVDTRAELTFTLALQWGHGISAVEVGQRMAALKNSCSASMGPRHFSRGSIV